MGLFDTFYVKHNEQKYGLQTKRLDERMNNYHVGDPVYGIANGVHVFFEHLFLNEVGESIFVEDENDPNEATEVKTVFIVLSHAVFVHYAIHDYKMEPEQRKIIEQKLMTEWNDSYRIITLLSQSNFYKKTKLDKAERLVRDLKLTLKYAMNPQKFEDLKNSSARFHFPPEGELINGTDPHKLMTDKIEEFLNTLKDEYCGKEHPSNDNRL